MDVLVPYITLCISIPVLSIYHSQVSQDVALWDAKKLSTTSSVSLN